MGVRAGDRIWCTAAAGWSKSLRNVWLAAELTGAETVLHDGPLRRRRTARAARPSCARGALHVADRVPDVRGGAGFGGPLLAAARGGRRRRGAGRRRPSSAGGRHTGSPSATATARPRPAPWPACWPARSRRRPERWAGRCPGVELRDRGRRAVRAWPRRCRRFFPATGGRAAHRRALHDGLWHTGDLVAATRRAALVTRPRRRRHLVVRLPDRAGRGRGGAALAPGRAECAAVGLADAERGQIVHADVIAASGNGRRRRASQTSFATTSAASPRRTSTRARSASSTRCRGRPPARSAALPSATTSPAVTTLSRKRAMEHGGLAPKFRCHRWALRCLRRNHAVRMPRGVTIRSRINPVEQGGLPLCSAAAARRTAGLGVRCRSRRPWASTAPRSPASPGRTSCSRRSRRRSGSRNGTRRPSGRPPSPP